METFRFLTHLSALVACHVGVLTYGTNIGHIKGNSTGTLVLMHSVIVNGHELLCDARTVLKPHRGTAALL